MLTILPTSDILRFWFSDIDSNETKSMWFDQSPDSYLTETYKNLVDSTVDNYQSLLEHNTTSLDHVALLLIGDQFTRNIYRHSEERTKNDVWALPLAIQMIQNDVDLTLPLPYRYFILLPLRHAKRSSLLDIVCTRVQLYKKDHDCPSLRNFYKHTIQNYTDLTDEIVYCDPIHSLDYKDEFLSVLEKNRPVLNQCQSSVLESIARFTTASVAVSLSGGVDSMVLLDALVNSGRFQSIVAIHVEYVNREEASVEREFLQYYCVKKGIRMYYRTIHYMKRDDEYIDRNVFEEETKKARFNLYKYVIDKENLNGVCLGHHMGDIVENVFTNMIKGRDVKHIKGMSEKQIIYGVTLFRPFLSLTKEAIFEYAHYHDIPYFLNTTPAWSCRGVLRDKVIPDLKAQFGHFEKNIIAFAERCAYLETFYQEEITRRLYETKSTFSTRITYGKEVMETLESIVMRFMHENGYKMASKKSIQNMMDWLQYHLHNQLQLSKDVLCFFRKGYVYLVNETKIKTEKPCLDLVKKELDDYLPNKLDNLYYKK
jgi:tRNA(Ile)-lysidine synthetase-like protein